MVPEIFILSYFFFYTFGQWSLTIYTPSPLPPPKKKKIAEFTFVHLILYWEPIA